MQIMLPKNATFNNKKDGFYTEDELVLLHQLENGLLPTKTNEEVMENLRKVLKLDEV